MSAADSEISSAGEASGGDSLFDSFDGWAQLLRQPPPTDAAAPARSAGGTGPRRPPPDAFPYRPLHRAAMALLRIVDDGREDGETIRLRGTGIDIGRSGNGVTIPHDDAVAPGHARIVLLQDGTWQLVDLGSATGTFVRVTEARLRHGGCILIGSTRLRFERDSAGDVAWLVHAPEDGPRRRHPCGATGCTVGGHGGSATIVLDDPFVSPLHAELFRFERQWRVVNRGRNGLWMRIERPVRLSATAQFQCGEQRFVFEPLPG